MSLIRPKRTGLIAAPYVKRLVAEKFRTNDTAFTFRMNAGFPGDINRGHPASIQPCLVSPINPVTQYGAPCMVDTAGGSNGGVRPVAAADKTAAITQIWGVTARPYPIQQATSSNQYGAVPYGSGAIPAQQPVDVLRGGYIMVPVVGSPVKGGNVWIWTAASGGGHTVGGFEAVDGSGNTVALDPDNYAWNSPPDATGIAELILNKF